MELPTKGSEVPRGSRRRLDVANSPFHPAYVVWELTLRCDLSCTHCGSRAGKARPNELSEAEALRVVDELARAGTREVVLIGGEAYLHPSFLNVTRALSERGIAPTITTGGRGIDRELARAMKAAGMARVSVSIDGLEDVHDRMRNHRGSFAAAIAALDFSREAGIPIAANTNLNRGNVGDLEALYEVLRDRGILAWQVQLTTPLGRAADREAMVFQPYDLLDLLPRLDRLKSRAHADRIRLLPGNNLGYYGPEEARLRSVTPEGQDRFRGCQAGKFVLGIESDGAVKGCPSLQTAHYVGGNLREKTLTEIWDDAPELGWTRGRTRESLSGFCASCPFADECLGGCSFTAHALLGAPGNNPYCHYRARDHQRRGLRERLVLVEEAPGRPFDHGRFEIIVEPFDSPEPTLPQPDLFRLTRRKPPASSS